MSFSTVFPLKPYLRGQVVSFCVMRKKANTKCLKQLTDDILKLDMRYSHSPSDDILKQRLLLKTEFDLLSTHQAENLILKSRLVDTIIEKRQGKF